MSRVAQRIKAKLKKQLEARFPELEPDIPEDQREGYIPDAVLKAIRQHMGKRPSDAGSGIWE